MNKLRAFILGISLAIAAGAVAVTGGGIPSFLRVSYLGVGIAPSSGVTRIRADNGGSGDTEILSQSSTAGDAYFRSTALGVTNWSAGTQRASSQYRICNSVGLTGTCATMTTAGALTTPGSITASAGNLSANASSGGVQVAVTNTDAVTNGAFSQGDFCNSSHCLHTLITGTAQSSAFVTNGPAAESAYVYTDSQPLCIGTSANCRLVIDASGNITAPGAGTVPWPISATGTFNLTISLGCTTTPTVPVTFVKTGTQVTLTFASSGSVTCTSNSTGFTLNGLPAAEQAARNLVLPVAEVQDNGTGGLIGNMLVSNSANISVGLSTVSGTHIGDGFGGSWTAAGLKGINAGATITYLTN